MRPVPVHRPSSAPPCRSSKSRRRAAARPCVRADVARVRASGPSPPRRCPAVDRPSPTDQARYSARRAARSNAGRTRSSPPPRRSNAPSPAARSSGNAAKTSRLRSPRTAPPTPPRSDDQQCKPCSPPRDSWPFHLPADNPHGNPHPVESISRKPYYTCINPKFATSSAPPSHGFGLHIPAGALCRRAPVEPPRCARARALEFVSVSCCKIQPQKSP